MCKYPEMSEFSDHTVFDQLCSTPFYEKNMVDTLKSLAGTIKNQNDSKNTLIKNAFTKKKSFKRIFQKPLYTELNSLENGKKILYTQFVIF